MYICICVMLMGVSIVGCCVVPHVDCILLCVVLCVLCVCGVLIYIFMCSATVCVIVFGWLVCVVSPLCLAYYWVGL